MKSKIKDLVLQLTLLGTITFLLTLPTSSHRLCRNYWNNIWERKLDENHESNLETIIPYDQDDIISLARGLQGAHPMLLVFDGTGFKSYLLGHTNYNSRYVRLIALMVHALESNHRHRFQPGQPVFQMVFTVLDFLSTECASESHHCPENAYFPPFVSFSSVFQDPSIFPTAKAFPNPPFSGCIINWKMGGGESCQWQQVNNSIKFEELKNRLIWRGSDFCFLHSLYDYESNDPQMRKLYSRLSLSNPPNDVIMEEIIKHYPLLTPRWKAVAMSLRERRINDKNGSNPWIDALFTRGFNDDVHSFLNTRGLLVTDSGTMDPMTMSSYKYQIDLGGGGGTTWEGTLTKLLMPGVLFHHVTPTKDWFYDRMKPFVHYIPVDVELENLQAQYEWAEANPEKVKMIAETSTQFAKYLLSMEYIEKVYKDLFIDYFGELIKAYQHKGGSWDECLEAYSTNGMKLQEIAHCDESSCHVEWAHGSSHIVSTQVGRG